MPTNLNLDDRLVDLAVQLGKHKTKRDAVNTALAEYVDHLRRVQALRQFGSFDFDDDYDYKRARTAS
ncbi:MAG: type II toxin-antitoxin system VapB family antitoxin [Oligoflexia bacterium]|nr:type II toxin-antitoxin system VapB family antitoxin [Oligoflexia bacterium]